MFLSIRTELGLPEDQLIDLFNGMGGLELSKKDLFKPDGCNPNDFGWMEMTNQIHACLFNGKELK